MDILVLIAGILSVTVGFVHSLLGEWLIFKKLRINSIVPTLAPKPFREKHIRILWATWHISSIFGWMVGYMLLVLAITGSIERTHLIPTIAVAMAASGVLVLLATQAKHPGWIGLLGVALLCVLSSLN
ncbi:hypothetical protein QWI17_02360 [Gilvimarinus sp. SDUM040013]|uniref:Uncharacterized protein n=1 Tax=Gilvimarinus gilvus TaxID=3058038 RepID=A0ABU4RZG4_9GAMM|nr:hypothetical protein [Gilvimarinus sp. SDUM040013]MDO3384675.1 hypothetical protein [Gilvimarinus sp. SDUM040013]MDX6850261.1 hypothetical protein [Gilvimarinus sp. SDUM040013]